MKWILLIIAIFAIHIFAKVTISTIDKMIILDPAAGGYCSKFEDQENLFEKCKDETRALYREYEGIIEKKCGKPKKPSEEPEGSFSQDWGECANNIIKNIKN
jgi:hypothetical protein